MVIRTRQFSLLSALCALSCALTVPAQMESATVALVPAAPAVAPSQPVELQTEVELETARYFTEGALKEAKDAFDRGNFKTAQKLLEDQGDADHVRFLRAMCAFRGGDFKKSGPALLALAKRYTAMKDRCSMYAGVSFEKTGDLALAVEAYEGVPEETVFFSTARFSLARVHQRMGELEAAKIDLLPLIAPGEPKRAEALAALAKLEESTGPSKPASRVRNCPPKS
jgi:tetratricopeptide (TPR) repeat protein